MHYTHRTDSAEPISKVNAGVNGIKKTPGNSQQIPDLSNNVSLFFFEYFFFISATFREASWLSSHISVFI